MAVANVARDELTRGSGGEESARGEGKRETQSERVSERKRKAGDTRRSEKRNRLRGWKRQTDRPFVIRKLACSNCDRSVDCRSGGREKRWQ